MKNHEKKDSFIVDGQHPYLGLNPFAEDHKDYFYGREKEVEDLCKLIDRNVATVIFGKSGIGKTSLIQAGLMPVLRNHYYLPIYLRIKFDDERKSPLEQVKKTIEAKIRELDKTAIAFNGLTLWEYFTSVSILKGFVKPLLFFDQFEEIFTIGEKNPGKIDEFLIEMADLVENMVPVTVQEKYKTMGKKLSFYSKEPSYRVMLSLREDYLPQMETLYTYMPAVGHSRYRLSYIKGENALKAVINPGKEILKSKELCIRIIKKIPQARHPDYTPHEFIDDSWEAKRIEPFLLSLFCYQLNEKRLEIKAEEIHEELLEKVNVDDIIKDHYQEKIEPFNTSVKTAIEDMLITPEGFRKLQDLNSLKDKYNIPEQDIHALVDKRIIRKETRYDLEYIELIHDILAPIVKETRDTRMEREQRLEEQRKKEEELAEKKKKLFYTQLIAVIIGIAAMISISMAWYALKQKQNAREQAQHAKKQTAIAEKEARVAKANELAVYSADLLHRDPTKSFRLAEIAFKTDPDNPLAYKALLDVYHSRNVFYSKEFKHKNDVTFALFSPDGKNVLTTCNDGAIRLWGLAGEKKWVYKGLKDAVKYVKVSLDGKFVFIATGRGTITHLSWDGNPLKVFKLPNRIESAALSPDGKEFITTALFDEIARIWDRRGNILHEIKHKDEVECAAYSRDGKYFATACDDDKIYLYNRDREKIREFETQCNSVKSIIFSPDSTHIIIGSFSGEIKKWNLKGKLVKTFEEHKDRVNSLSFSPDGKYLLSASKDNTAKVHDLEGNLIKTLRGHTGPVNSVCISSNKDYMVTASGDNTVKLWPMKEVQELADKIRQLDANCVAFSPEGKKILFGNEKKLYLWDSAGKPIWEKEKKMSSGSQLLFSPKGKFFLILDENEETLKRDVWQLQLHRTDGKEIWKMAVTFRRRSLISGLSNIPSFSPDGECIITADKSNRQLKLLNLDGEVLRIFEIPDYDVFTATFSPDSKYIVITGRTGLSGSIAWLWDWKNNEKIKYTGHSGSVKSSTFSPDGKYIITASSDKTLRLWDLKGNQLKIIKGHNGRINSAVFSPDGKYILSASSDDTAALWNLKGNPITVFKGHTEDVNCARFSPDNKYIITASNNETLRLWNLKGNMLKIFRTSSIFILPLEPLVLYSNDGNYILSFSSIEGLDNIILVNPGKVVKLLNDRGYYPLDLASKIKYNIKVDINADSLTRLFNDDLFEYANYFYRESLITNDESIKQSYIDNSKTCYHELLKRKKIWEDHITLYELGKNLEENYELKVFLNYDDEVILEEYIKYFKQETKNTLSNSEKLELFSFVVKLHEKLLGIKFTKENRTNAANDYWNLSWYQLLDKKFDEAEISIERGLELDNSIVGLYINLADVYLYTGRFEKAEKIYLENKDKKIGEKTFREIFLEDIDDLERNGVFHKDVPKIKELLKKNGK